VDYQYQIFSTVALLASGLNLVLALISLRYYKRSPEALSLGLLMLAISFWTGAIGIQMLQETISAARLWLAIRMAGVVSVPVFWLLFALKFSGFEVRNIHKIFIGLIPAAAYLLFLTRGTHSYFVRQIHFSEIQGYMIDLRWNLGPLFWVHFAYSYLLIITGSVFIFHKALQLRHFYRKQAAVLVLGVLIPSAVNITSYLDLFPSLYVNYDPLGFLFAGLALTYALFRLRLFDLLPIAQKVLIDSMRDGMLVLDLDHRIIEANPAAKVILIPDNQEIVGAHLEEISPLASSLVDALESRYSGQTEISIGEGENRTIYLVELNPLFRDGQKAGMLVILKDITSQRKRERNLWEEAIRDPMTGMYNRRYLSEIGKREFERASRHNHELSVVLFDLDKFKFVNDSYGHMIGDQLLKDISERCQESTRRDDILARYGGDEFIILSLGTGLRGAVELAERIREAITHTDVVSIKNGFNPSASFGVASLNEGGCDSLDDLINRADRALYYSKNLGGNTVTGWSRDMSN